MVLRVVGLIVCALIFVSLAVFVLVPCPAGCWTPPIPDGARRIALANGVETDFWSERNAAADSRVYVYLNGGPGARITRRHEAKMRGLFPHRNSVLFEHPASGNSTHLASTEYTLDRQIEYLDAFLSKQAFSEVVLVGSSWGATLAAHYTWKHPERVVALVQLAPGPLLREQEHRRQGVGVPRLNLIAAWVGLWNQSLSDLILPRGHRSQWDRDGFSEEANFLIMRDFLERPRPFGRVNVPTLVVRGIHDSFDLSGYSAHFTNIAFVEVKGDHVLDTDTCGVTLPVAQFTARLSGEPPPTQCREVLREVPGTQGQFTREVIVR